MIAGLAMQDEKVLSVGAVIESALAANGHAVHGLYFNARSTTFI
jgi:hypothetical protein